MQWIGSPLYTENCRRFNGVGERRVGLDGGYESAENVPGLLLSLMNSAYDGYDDAILSETGSGIRTIQELLGHRDVKTTIIHTISPASRAVRCPQSTCLCVAHRQAG